MTLKIPKKQLKKSKEFGDRVCFGISLMSFINSTIYSNVLEFLSGSRQRTNSKQVSKRRGYLRFVLFIAFITCLSLKGISFDKYSLTNA